MFVVWRQKSRIGAPAPKGGKMGEGREVRDRR